MLNEKILQLYKLMKNPAKNYQEWFWERTFKIYKHFYRKYLENKPEIEIVNFAITPYFDETKNKIVIPIYTLLDISLLLSPFLFPLYILNRIRYLFSLPATFAHELSHSTREQKHALANKPYSWKNILKGSIYVFKDEKLKEEERKACKEALEAIRIADMKMYSLNPFYALNEATLLAYFSRKSEDTKLLK